jgi:hypothetical protein
VFSPLGGCLSFIPMYSNWGNHALYLNLILIFCIGE